MDLTSISNAARMQPPDFAQMREKMFKKADADGSGTLTKDELSDAIANAPKPPGGGDAPDVDEMFSRMDADGDGLVTQEEHDSALEEMDAERGQGPMSFDGSTNALQTLLSALQSKDSESGTTSSTELEDLLDRLLSQLSQGGTYSSTGSTKGTSISSFFESSS